MHLFVFPQTVGCEVSSFYFETNYVSLKRKMTTYKRRKITGDALFIFYIFFRLHIVHMPSGNYPIALHRCLKIVFLCVSQFYNCIRVVSFFLHFAFFFPLWCSATCDFSHLAKIIIGSYYSPFFSQMIDVSEWIGNAGKSCIGEI